VGIIGSALAGIPLGKLVYDIYDYVWWWRGGYSRNDRPCNVVAKNIMDKVLQKYDKEIREKIEKTFSNRLNLIVDFGLYRENAAQEIGYIRRHWAIAHSLGAALTSAALSIILSVIIVLNLWVSYPNWLNQNLVGNNFIVIIQTFLSYITIAIFSVIFWKARKRVIEIVEKFHEGIIVSAKPEMEQILKKLCEHEMKSKV
jgi:hypothetical protein